MKRTVLILSMLIIMSSSVMARRLEIPAKVGVSILRQGTTVKLFYKAASVNDVNVRIYDSQGQLRFKETIRKVDGFVRPYNFDGLPKDDYIIEVTDRSSQSIEKVTYDADADVYRPFATLVRLKGDGRKYLLTIANRKNEKLSVKIFNDQDKLLYEEPAGITADFSQVYNLVNVSKKIRVVITTEKGNSVRLSN